MGRKCSQCGSIGHNSRTCSNYNMTTAAHQYHTNNNNNVVVNAAGVRLFGVHLDIPPSPSVSASASASPSNSNRMIDVDDYLSDEPTFGRGGGGGGGCADRKKGVAWTEEEHRMFLKGLDKLGKGDWKGISRKYVVTRSPTQVASHAQKYFLRQTSCSTNNKRRSSLFDLVVCADHGGNSSSSSRWSRSSSKTNDYFDDEEKDLDASMMRPPSRACCSNNNNTTTTSSYSPDLELTLSANESSI